MQAEGDTSGLGFPDNSLVAVALCWVEASDTLGLGFLDNSSVERGWSLVVAVDISDRGYPGSNSVEPASLEEALDISDLDFLDSSWAVLV